MTTYYVSDQINSARMMLAAGGWPVSQDTYYPFGVESYPPADQNHYHFTGKERDAETGNDYFGARYYGSTMGRFMSPDFSDTPEAMPYADLSNPQSFNRYVYLNDNPLGGIDADGHQTKDQNGNPCDWWGVLPGRSARTGDKPVACGAPAAAKTQQKVDAHHAGATSGLGFTVGGEVGVGKNGAALNGNLNLAMSVKDGHASVALVDNHVGMAFHDKNVAGTQQDGQPLLAGANGGVAVTGFVSNAQSANDLKGPFQTKTLNLPFISLQLSTSGDIHVFSLSIGFPGGYSYSNITTETTVGCITGCN